jgi:HSP20 family protein
MNTLRWDQIRTRWNPSKERDEIESQLATLFGLRDVTGNGGKESLTVAQWSPLIDILETAHEYLIKAKCRT